MDTMKVVIVGIILIASLWACKEDPTNKLIIQEAYGLASWEKQGLIKGDLFVAGESEPLYSGLESASDGQIVIENILEGSYKFEYFVKPDGKEYWPIPKDTVFQIRAYQTLVILVK